jgi:hypothetical protein
VDLPGPLDLLTRLERAPWRLLELVDDRAGILTRASRCLIDHSESPGRTVMVVTWAEAGRRSGAVRVELPSAAPACAITSTSSTPTSATTSRRRQ